MGDDTLKVALEALTATTKAGRLRELMPTIEAKVAAGVRHEEILEALNANGFDLTERTYKTYLYRFRKAVKTGKAVVRAPKAMETGKPDSETPAVQESAPALVDSLDASKREQRAKSFVDDSNPFFRKEQK